MLEAAKHFASLNINNRDVVDSLQPFKQNAAMRALKDPKKYLAEVFKTPPAGEEDQWSRMPDVWTSSQLNVLWGLVKVGMVKERLGTRKRVHTNGRNG